MWSGAARSTPSNDKTDRTKPSAWRKGNRKTRRSVNAVSIAQSENVFGAPGRPDGAGRHASVASAESPSVTSPRWTKACSYADHFPTRYVVLYVGWTFDLMSRSCTRSGHRGQRAYSCLVAAEGLCTNAVDRHEDFIQEPRISESTLSALQLPSVVGAECLAPLPNGFVRHDDASFGQQILNIPEAHAVSVVEPDGMADDVGRKAMPKVAGPASVHPGIVLGGELT